MPPRSGEEIDARLSAVLDREEFQALAEDAVPSTHALAEMIESLFRALRALAGDLQANHPFVFILLLLVGLAVLGVSVWFGARGAARRSVGEVEQREARVELLAGDPAILAAEAERAASERRFLDAVRLSFRATIIARARSEGTLPRVGDAVTFRRTRTYRELVEEFARGHAQAERMERLAGRIELGLYAGAELEPADWDAARALARELR